MFGAPKLPRSGRIQVLEITTCRQYSACIYCSDIHAFVNNYKMNVFSYKHIVYEYTYVYVLLVRLKRAIRQGTLFAKRGICLVEIAHTRHTCFVTFSFKLNFIFAPEKCLPVEPISDLLLCLLDETMVN